MRYYLNLKMILIVKLNFKHLINIVIFEYKKLLHFKSFLRDFYFIC